MTKQIEILTFRVNCIVNNMIVLYILSIWIKVSCEFSCSVVQDAKTRHTIQNLVVNAISIFKTIVRPKKVECKLCNSEFSINRKGIGSINENVQTKTHRKS